MFVLMSDSFHIRMPVTAHYDPKLLFLISVHEANMNLLQMFKDHKPAQMVLFFQSSMFNVVS